MSLPAHDAAILGAVRAGAYSLDWVPVDLGPLTVEVTADALRLTDGLRPSTTPIAAQLIADVLGAALLTPRLSDLLWQRADVRLSPHTQPIVGGGWRRCPDCTQQHRGPWARCQPCGEREHSRAIDRELVLHRALDRIVLVGGIGKPWTIARSCWARPGRMGHPYGWYVAAGGVAAVTRGLHVIQGCGPVAPHDGWQLDYAESWRGWRPVALTLAELWARPELLELVAHDAPPHWRLPGVPQQGGADGDGETPPSTLRTGHARATAPPAAVDYADATWIPACHWSSSRAEPVRLVVLHSTETPSTAGTARRVAQWFARGADCRASAHYVIDVGEVAQCVREHYRAWSAGPRANATGVHIELCGYAEVTDWSAGDGLAVLERAAPLAADILRRHELPCVGLDGEQVARGERGMCTHAACTAAWHESTHVDPGMVGDRRWPWERWTALVQAALDARS